MRRGFSVREGTPGFVRSKESFSSEDPFRCVMPVVVHEETRVYAGGFAVGPRFVRRGPTGSRPDLLCARDVRVVNQQGMLIRERLSSDRGRLTGDGVPFIEAGNNLFEDVGDIEGCQSGFFRLGDGNAGDRLDEKVCGMGWLVDSCWRRGRRGLRIEKPFACS